MAVSVATMQLTLSIAIMQAPTYFPVMQVLRSYCNYVGVPSATTILVDLFVATTQVLVSVAIMQLEVSAAFIQVKVSSANMWVTISY